MKEISKLNKKNRIEEKLINNSYATIVLNSLLFILLISLIYMLFFDFFHNVIGVDLLVFFSVAATIPLTSLTSLYAQILRAHNRYYLFQWHNLNLLYILFCSTLLIIYYLDLNQNYIFFGYLVSTVIIFILSYKQALIKTRIILRAFKYHLYIKQMAYSFDFFATQFITQGFNWTSIILAAIFINEIDTGALNIINKYLSLCSLMIIIINTKVGPSYAHLFHSGKINELNNVISSNTKIMFILSIPLLLFMFLLPELLLSFFSDKYLHLKNVFRIMLIGYFVNLYCGSTGMLMQMTDGQKTYRNIMAFSFLTHICLGFFLAKYLGALGIGISLCLVLVFWNLVSAYILRKKYNVISYLNL